MAVVVPRQGRAICLACLDAMNRAQVAREDLLLGILRQHPARPADMNRMLQQRGTAMPKSTLYATLGRLVAQGVLVREGALYRIVG